MKVEIKLNETLTEPIATIQAPSLTDELQRTIAILKNSASRIVASDQERIIILSPDDLYLVRIEDKVVRIYTQNKHYTTNKKLYEMEEMLGSTFMRISKTTIINLKYVHYVEPAFSGAMYLVMKNGCKDSISRSYLSNFKKYLGI